MNAPTHPIIREALAAHEVFRKLGFTPDEIFIRPRPDELFVTVRRSGLEFNFTLGKHDFGDVNTVIALWVAATEWWNMGPEAERTEMYERSETRKTVVPLIVALKAKGFAIHRSDA